MGNCPPGAFQHALSMLLLFSMAYWTSKIANLEPQIQFSFTHICISTQAIFYLYFFFFCLQFFLLHPTNSLLPFPPCLFFTSLQFFYPLVLCIYKLLLYLSQRINLHFNHAIPVLINWGLTRQKWEKKGHKIWGKWTSVAVEIESPFLGT